MTFCGIWIDSAHAYIIEADEFDIVSFETLGSEVESRRNAGIEQDERFITTNQKSLDRRREHELKDFVHEIIQRIKNTDSFLIFGPGKAKLTLQDELEKNADLAKRLVSVETSDSMTENQMKAYVKEFFSLPKE